MEHVDALPTGEPVRDPGKIVKATVAQMSQRVALVTGASAGPGVDFARQLAAKGYRLAASRGARRGSTPATELGHARAIAIDLSELGAAVPIDGRPRRAWRSGRPAGEQRRLRPGRPVRHARRARQREMIDLNCGALVELAHAVLPGMVERRRGAILNVASTAASAGTGNGRLFRHQGLCPLLQRGTA